ncbi:sugar phosphate isomerase/epimerase [Arthrobacter sp. UYP6]|uniref:ATP-binding protein n=1 Tax=Arthrobacter sp. UYP6 TaxID=1756378 RepID=UPI00339B5416
MPRNSQTSHELTDAPMENPFRPSAGATPPQILGRAGVLDEFEYGLRLGSGAPGLLTIFTGARGIGKTVMLGAAHDLAREKGWAVISETATSGFMGRIGESMRQLAEELGNGPVNRRITAIAAAGFSITTALPPERQVAWRTLGEELLRLLADRGNGLIITVDEIHAADRRELAQLAASVQHFIQDRLPIGLVFAGLPAAVSDLLNEGVATFLRRADKIDLHAAAVREVEESFAATFAAAGFRVSHDLVRQAAEATGGYPFLIQLVGYFLWREAEGNQGDLNPERVARAIQAANRRNARTVIEAALAAASPKDLDFLFAMAEDDGPSTAGEIGRRLGAKSNLVANYRSRLLAAGLIESAGHGKVDFAIPGLRQYLRAKSGVS